MATFLWLMMINFTLWKNLKNLGIEEESRFFKYCIIVWSIASVLLTAFVVADRYLPEDIPGHLKPEVGVYNCLIKSKTIYTYDVLDVLIVVSFSD